MEETYHLPETGFIRLPAVLYYTSLKESDWWNGVKSGVYPQSVKLGCNGGITAWRVEDIRAFINSKAPQNI